MTPARWPPSGRPVASSPTSPCATAPCCRVSAPGWTAREHWPDADAWYFILEGTREQSVAEAQAMALTELTAALATSPGTEPRTILLACDDYSAVSGRVPLWQLYERGRSLGIGVQVSAQSWQGLGDSEDERYRIAATADGGMWLLRTPYPQPVCELAGTHRIIETATKVIGGMWGDEGSSRIQHAWTVNPQIARQARTPGRPPTSTAAAPPGSRSPAPSPHHSRSRHPSPARTGRRHSRAGPRSTSHHRRRRRLRRRPWKTHSGRRPADDRRGPVRRAGPACPPGPD